MTYQIQYEPRASRQDIDRISQGIAEFVRSKMEFTPAEHFSFVIRNENNELIGGCDGVMYYGSMYVDILWVSEKLRGQDYGSKLMQAAEKLAREKNCSFVTVFTMNFEAPEFYQKLGYYIEFERHGYLNNSILYMLRKDL